MSEMSLVDKARKIDRRKQIIVTSDEVDLAIEWAHDRLSGPQILGALGKPTA
jgi:hypothetical protein